MLLPERALGREETLGCWALGPPGKSHILILWDRLLFFRLFCDCCSHRILLVLRPIILLLINMISCLSSAAYSLTHLLNVIDISA